jgi:hypothetical protein
MTPMLEHPQTARPGTGKPILELSADADRQSGACCTPNQATHDAGWVQAAPHAKVLAWFSLAWMTGEGVLGLVAGITANSISLIGWALGSVIEGLASIIVIWRFTGSRTVSETSERHAQRAVAISFFLLAPYIAVESVRDLVADTRSHRPFSGFSSLPPAWL